MQAVSNFRSTVTNTEHFFWYDTRLSIPAVRSIGARPSYPTAKGSSTSSRYSDRINRRWKAHLFRADANGYHIQRVKHQVPDQICLCLANHCSIIVRSQKSTMKSNREENYIIPPKQSTITLKHSN